MLASELISLSWYLSTIVSYTETVSGDQKTLGLELLNDLLAQPIANTSLIPYYGSYDFNTQAGVEEYFIENLIYPETVTYELSGVRYPLNSSTREEYFGQGRADTVQTLPSMYRFEQGTKDKKVGSYLYIYPLPDNIYAAVIWGKFSLQEVLPETDLSLHFDRNYRLYLRYALAQLMCHQYSVSFPPEIEKKLYQLKNNIMKINPPESAMKKISILQRNSSNFSYIQANLGNGWTPP